MGFLETVICLIILRCESYLKNIGVKDSLDDFPTLSHLLSRLDDDAVLRWSLVTGRDPESKVELNKEESRYLSLISMMGNDNVMQSLLDLCLAVFSYPEFDAYLTHCFGYSVTLKLAYSLEEINYPEESDVYEKLSLAEVICDTDTASSPILYIPLSIDERVFSFLSGNDDISPRLSDFTEVFRCGKKSGINAPFVNEEEIRKGGRFLKKGGKVLQISGKGGRRFAARQISSYINRDLILINIADLFTEGKKSSLNELKGALIREARFDSSGICIFGITEEFIGGKQGKNEIRTRRDLEMLERMVFMPVIEAGIPLILISDKPRILMRTLSEKEYRIIELPERLDHASRLKMWEGFIKYYRLDLSPGEMAGRYHLNASETAGVIQAFLERRDDEKPDSEEEMLSRISMERLKDSESGDTGKVIYPGVRLGDVKVKKELRMIFDDVVDSVRSSAKVLDDWGLRTNYPYGRCVSLLLSGPPGTGKTMTANAIAGELGLPLYQVNISNIVDKYIGETEKNLEKAFSFAEKTNVVLFFDEADSIFGTRSEVHDSKDRYANTEISYLLQRIEAYDGIVIMATNIKGNIDPAFIRRIRYVAHFENPDESLRKEIWLSCLKDSVPHDEIDTDYLASQFDKFTGSVIKTVFLNACSYAAGRDEDLQMKHIIHAVKRELEKTSSVAFTMDTLGKYAYIAN